MSSSAIRHLVSFLTRPLTKFHSPATIFSIQLCLHTSLSSASTQAESSLLLSANCPPPALQRACLVSGVRWAQWIDCISSGIDVRIFITESSLAVEVGRMPRRIVWVAPDDASPPAVKSESAKQSFCSSAVLPMPPSLRSRLRATSILASARERNCRSAALNPTRIPTLLASSYKADDIASSSQSDSDSDSDSDYFDSDSDSGTSASSATSISDASSSSSSRSLGCPSLPAKPVVDVTRYTHEGGVTQVLSGGVMLGVSLSPKSHRGPGAVFSNGRPSGTSRNAARRTGVSAVDSWRKSA